MRISTPSFLHFVINFEIAQQFSFFYFFKISKIHLKIWDPRHGTPRLYPRPYLSRIYTLWLFCTPIPVLICTPYL